MSPALAGRFSTIAPEAFLIFANQLILKWNFILVLVYISLGTNHVERVLMYLVAICVSFVKFLNYFSVGLVVLFDL